MQARKTALPILKSISILLLLCNCWEKDCTACLCYLVCWGFVSHMVIIKFGKEFKIQLVRNNKARQCCMDNLQKEVEATKASGILPGPDGHVEIACSGDTGWQGNSLHCTYNSQSRHTTLC